MNYAEHPFFVEDDKDFSFMLDTAPTVTWSSLRTNVVHGDMLVYCSVAANDSLQKKHLITRMRIVCWWLARPWGNIPVVMDNIDVLRTLAFQSNPLSVENLGNTCYTQRLVIWHDLFGQGKLPITRNTPMRQHLNTQHCPVHAFLLLRDNCVLLFEVENPSAVTDSWGRDIISVAGGTQSKPTLTNTLL